MACRFHVVKKRKLSDAERHSLASERGKLVRKFNPGAKVSVDEFTDDDGDAIFTVVYFTVNAKGGFPRPER
jgi:hypothetical protein